MTKRAPLRSCPFCSSAPVGAYVERVAHLIDTGISEGRIPFAVCRALARWHLAAVKRARGRTVGYVGVSNAGKKCVRLTDTFWTTRVMTEVENHGRENTSIGRVVLVSRKKGKR